jgi:hypothetical protein
VLTASNELEMWGDGKQTRSFTFIDDCVEGILRITKSDFREPLNLGSTEMVSMNEMMEMVGGRDCGGRGACAAAEGRLGCPWGCCVCGGGVGRGGGGSGWARQQLLGAPWEGGVHSVRSSRCSRAAQAQPGAVHGWAGSGRDQPPQ